MEISLNSKGSKNVVEITGLPSGTSYEEKMLTFNQLNYIPPFSEIEIDGRKKFCFTIDGLVSLAEIFHRVHPGKAELIEMLNGLSACIAEMKQLLLNPSHLILSLQWIFFDQKRKHFLFLMVPGQEEDFPAQFKGLLEEMMKVFRHTNREEEVFLYEIYSKSLVDRFSPDYLFENLPAWICTNEKMLSEEKIKQEEASCKRAEKNFLVEREPQGKKVIPANELDQEIETTKIPRVYFYMGLGIFVLMVLGVILFGFASLKVTGVAAAGYVIYVLAVYFQAKNRAEEQEIEQAFLDEKIKGKEGRIRNENKVKGAVFAKDDICPKQESFSKQENFPKQEIFPKPESGGDREFNRKTESSRVHEFCRKPESSRVHEFNRKPESGMAHEFCRKPESDTAHEFSRNQECSLALDANRNQEIIRKDEKSEYHLIPLNPDQAQEILLQRGRTILGRRRADCDVVISVMGVSRKHAAIDVVEGRVYVTDFASTNGTYVEDKKMPPNATWEIRHGNRIRFGGIEFYFV